MNYQFPIPLITQTTCILCGYVYMLVPWFAIVGWNVDGKLFEGYSTSSPQKKSFLFLANSLQVLMPTCAVYLFQVPSTGSPPKKYFPFGVKPQFVSLEVHVKASPHATSTTSVPWDALLARIPEYFVQKINAETKGQSKPKPRLGSIWLTCRSVSDCWLWGVGGWYGTWWTVSRCSGFLGVASNVFFHCLFFSLTTRSGELVLAELRRHSPRAGEPYGRFVRWLGMVHFVAPEAVGLVKADDGTEEPEE